ncbi:hypothetical protein M9H77_27758 [Catharanthus roseus]|uniref:Uncharacterized protein n=1 Tax=Catharanthus roseus TaxID=4058 RepID=A0ACC0AF29_CATRO|nr:hypothetical protein M9H77_27758 [Catharanthus roseus]
MVQPGARRSDDDLGPVADRTGRYFFKIQIPLNDVSGPRLQLGAQFFEQLAGSVPVDSSYSGADYGATDYGNPSSDVGLGRHSGTSQSKEAVTVGSLRIHRGEDDKDEREDDGGHDDDGDGDGDGDDNEPIPVAQASSSGHRPAPGKGKSKIVRSRQKKPEKLCPATNPMQRKKAKNDGWEQTGPVDGGPQDPVLVPSYSGHFAGSIWRGQDRGILKLRSRYVSMTGWAPSDPAVVQLAEEVGLSHLRSCMFQHPNSSLLSAFVKRWQPDTNSFHMHWGEMTVILHDVELILGVSSYSNVVDHHYSRE